MDRTGGQQAKRNKTQKAKCFFSPHRWKTSRNYNEVEAGLFRGRKMNSSEGGSEQVQITYTSKISGLVAEIYNPSYSER